MATYGTIPTACGKSSPLDFISRAKARCSSALGTRRPWREMVHFHAFSLPHGVGEAYLRIRSNAGYFSMNYAIIVILIAFLTLIWYPISMIVFFVMMYVWLFLYFLRDEPVAVLGRTINDLYILIALSLLTLVILLLTGTTANILISLLIEVVVVLFHALFRKTDDLFLDEEAAGPGGCYAAIGEASGPSRRS